MKTLTAERVITEIDSLHGNLSAVARRLDVSRTTLYKFISDRQTVKAALDEAREQMVDKTRVIWSASGAVGKPQTDTTHS